MNLFINSVSSHSYICFFDGGRKIITEKILQIAGNESSGLIPELEMFFHDNKVKYSEIKNIVVVNGPGSFTGVRTAVLIANTMNFIIKAHMTSLSYFDLFENYPIVKHSSKRDCFFQKSHDSDIMIIGNEELSDLLSQDSIELMYGETNYDFQNVTIVEKIDYNRIIQNIVFDTKEKLEPLYIKKPNIC